LRNGQPSKRYKAKDDQDDRYYDRNGRATNKEIITATLFHPIFLSFSPLFG